MLTATLPSAEASRFLSYTAQTGVLSLPVTREGLCHAWTDGAQSKFQRLTGYYRIPIAYPLQQDLLVGLGRLQTVITEKGAHFEKGRDGAKARLSAAREVYPSGPRWLQDLLIHLYLERKTHPDQFGFVLRTARLMQGVSNIDVGVGGFNEHRIKYLEKGSLLKRGSFREAVRIYGVPYRALAYSYLKQHGPHIPWNDLPFYPGPIFLDAAERPKIEGYVDHPGSLGERIFFARALKDRTQQELVEEVQKEISDLVPSGRLRRIPPKTGFNKQDLEHVEANRSYLPLAKCLALSAVLQIPWNDFLRTLLKTYAPNLLSKSERLRREPVFVNYGESGDERKILAYAAEPGSPGERIFWARKSRLWTIEDLAEIAGVRGDQIYPFELNRKSPSDEVRCRLEAALELSI